jgi:VWFA-related protein
VKGTLHKALIAVVSALSFRERVAEGRVREPIPITFSPDPAVTFSRKERGARQALIIIAGFALLYVLLAFPSVSQTPAQGSDNKPFQLKTNTEIVLVNVQVRDSKGTFVRDLRQEDFTVTEDGKTQKILSIDIENTDALTSNDVQAANLLGDLNGATATEIQNQVKLRAQQPSPTEYTRDSFRDRRLMVLFFDLTSMQPEEVKRGIESADKFIDDQLRPSDLVAVVSLSTRFNTDQDFTNNKEDLKAALSGLNPDSANGFAEGATADDASTDDATTDQTFTADETETNTFNADRKLDALRTMFETLQGIDQKKSVVYFSGGLRTSGIDNQTSLRAAINAAVRSNTSIYPIDVRGLQAIVPGGDASTGSRRGQGLFNGSGVRGQFNQQRQSQDTLVTLAADTGGKAFLDTNNFGPAFTKIQEDTAMYYVLSYASSNTMKDGRYRQIRVTVKGKDLRVDARRGYYADTDFQHLAKEGREKQLQDELAADLPSTDLPVYLSTGYFKLDDTRYFIPASIVVPGSAIPFSRESDQDRATLDILGAVIDPGRPGFEGERGGGERGGGRGGPPPQQQGPRVFGQIKDTVKLALNTTEDVKRKNVQYEGGFLLPPGRYRLRFIVRENETGQIGSFETDIFVPNLMQAPVKISSVVASAQKQPAKAKKDNPLTRDGAELIPNVTHVFSKNQHLYLFYEVYDPKHPEDVDSRDKTAARLLTNAAFYKGDSKVYETPLVAVNHVNTPERHAAAVELDVPLSEFKAGFYTCQVNVIDDAAGQFVFPRLSLLVR